MKRYKNYKEYYLDNYSTEEYKNYYQQRQAMLNQYLNREYMEEVASLADRVGYDVADFGNEIINSLTVKDNQIVFNGNMKTTKTYSFKVAELFARQLGKALADLPGELVKNEKPKKRKK